MFSPKGGHKAAILLLDFQNEFAKEGGKLHDSVKDVMASTGMLEKVPKLLDVARDSGALVIHSPVVMKTGVRFEEAEFDPQAYGSMTGLFEEGTWNSEFVEELQPGPGEEILSGRNDFCAFRGTELASILKRSGVRTVVLCGFLSNICIEETARACFDELPDLRVIVCSDGCAAKTREDHDNAMNLTLPIHGCEVVLCSEAAELIRITQASDSEHEEDPFEENRGPNVVNGKPKRATRATLFQSSAFRGTWFHGNVAVADEDGPTAEMEETVDSIFSFFGGQNDGKQAPEAIKVSGLAAALRLIGEEDIERALADIKSKANKEGDDDFTLTREQLIDDVIAAQIDRTFMEEVAAFILIWILPLLYSASTRLPFIFLSLEMVQTRGGELWQVGVVLGSYQMCRALGNLIITRFGGGDPIRRLHLFMVMIGMMGWIFANNLIFPSFDGQWNLLALCAVGFSETVVNLQTALVAETKAESRARITNPFVLSVRMRKQYAGVSGGAFFAFIVGGVLYNNMGFGYVCFLGMALHVLQVLFTVLFLCFRMYVPVQSSHLSFDPTANELDPLTSIHFRIEAVKVLLENAKEVIDGVGAGLVRRDDSAQSARNAMADKNLTHSLALLYDAIFTRPRKQREGASATSAVENKTAKSHLRHFLEPATTTKIGSVIVPTDARTISETAVKLMDSVGDGNVNKMEFIVFLAPLVHSRVHGDTRAEEVDVIWPYLTYIVLTQAVMVWFHIGEGRCTVGDRIRPRLLNALFDPYVEILARTKKGENMQQLR